MAERELLLRVTKKDFEIQTFRSGGKGGQNQNKVNSGVRIIHKASGARGESRDSRTYEQNKRQAFLRLNATDTFKAWLKIETARALGKLQDVEAEVARQMVPKNLRVELREDGKWVSE